MKRKALISLIVILGFGCLAPGPVRCDPGETWFECILDVFCNNKKMQLTQRRKWICAADELQANSRALLSGPWSMTDRLPSNVALDLMCKNSGSALKPKYEEVLASFDPGKGPESWRDPDCNACISARCGELAYACFQEVGGCHCLDQCQVGLNAGDVVDLNDCGCPIANTQLYESFRSCADSNCRDICFPSQVCQ